LLTRHSTGADPGGGKSPIFNSSRALTIRSPYHGGPAVRPQSRGRQWKFNTRQLSIKFRIIELESSEDDAVSILANDLPVAKGTVEGNRIAAVEVAELMPRQ
jgi:hypothetical protein